MRLIEAPRGRTYGGRVTKIALALIPSVGVLFLFVVVIRAMLEGDRRERAAQARFEAEQDAAGAPDPSSAPHP